MRFPTTTTVKYDILSYEILAGDVCSSYRPQPNLTTIQERTWTLPSRTLDILQKRSYVEIVVRLTKLIP